MQLGIAEAVRLLAAFPITYGPEPPPEAPAERLRDGRFTVLFFPGPSGQLIEAIDLGEDVAATLDEVRSLLRGRGRDRATWFVGPSSRPAGVLERLRACGLEPSYEPPWEPRYASMVLVEPPDPGPPEVVVRPVESFDEFVQAHRLEDDVIERPEEDRRAHEEHQRTLWELHESDSSQRRVYVGLLDGDIVGVGRALFADVAVDLIGGSVRPESRGRGVYRALVRARWDDAVARGTPALTVQAGRMSRPVLERLGFEVVSLQECLTDRFDRA